MTIKCCIVDDEPLARAGIEGYVEQIPYLTHLGSFSSALDLLNKLEELNPDLLFLDIQMPHLTGLDFVKSLNNPPKVIFTTAYDQYALEGFELDVVDYLMKPISFDRFLKATEKAKTLFQGTQDSFFVKTDKRMEKVRYDDILFLESMQNYVILQLKETRLITHTTLKSIVDSLPSSFIQIHKQYVINRNHVNALEGNQVIIKDNKLPVSRTYRDQALNAILNNR